MPTAWARSRGLTAFETAAINVWVDDRERVLRRAAEQVAGAGRLGNEELAQDHLPDGRWSASITLGEVDDGLHRLREWRGDGPREPLGYDPDAAAGRDRTVGQL